MNMERFTTKAQQALADAQRLAHGYNHQELDGEHVLLALVEQGESLVPLVLQKLGVALPALKANKVRAIAVTSAQRSAILPDVPSIAEAGLKGYEVTGWYGVVMPAGVPAPVVAKLNGEINQVLKTPAVREHLVGQGVELTGGTPAAFGEAPVGFPAFAGVPLFQIWTTLHVPSVTMPVFKGPHGLPVGAQVIGKANGDRALFAAARRIYHALA